MRGGNRETVALSMRHLGKQRIRRTCCIHFYRDIAGVSRNGVFTGEKRNAEVCVLRHGKVVATCEVPFWTVGDVSHKMGRDSANKTILFPVSFFVSQDLASCDEKAVQLRICLGNETIAMISTDLSLFFRNNSESLLQLKNTVTSSAFTEIAMPFSIFFTSSCAEEAILRVCKSRLKSGFHQIISEGVYELQQQADMKLISMEKKLAQLENRCALVFKAFQLRKSETWIQKERIVQARADLERMKCAYQYLQTKAQEEKQHVQNVRFATGALHDSLENESFLLQNATKANTMLQMSLESQTCREIEYEGIYRLRQQVFSRAQRAYSLSKKRMQVYHGIAQYLSELQLGEQIAFHSHSHRSDNPVLVHAVLHLNRGTLSFQLIHNNLAHHVSSIQSTTCLCIEDIDKIVLFPIKEKHSKYAFQLWSGSACLSFSASSMQQLTRWICGIDYCRSLIQFSIPSSRSWTPSRVRWQYLSSTLLRRSAADCAK